MGAVAEEKENRTMEIVVTSVSPLELIGGKILGIIAIGLTLMMVWTMIVILGIITSRWMGIGWFQDLTMDWNAILATLFIAVPAYVLVCAIMVTIGTIVTSTQEGQSFSSVFIILHMIPLYLGVAFIESPGGSLATTLTLLPFTSLMATAMRNLFYSVPAWQIALSVFVQTICAIGSIWLASRAFRLGMLRYGQRLQWRNLFQSGQIGE
jgi:ABC-2 type transport system permease protein